MTEVGDEDLLHQFDGLVDVDLEPLGVDVVLQTVRFWKKIKVPELPEFFFSIFHRYILIPEFQKFPEYPTSQQQASAVLERIRPLLGLVQNRDLLVDFGEHHLETRF